MLINSRILKKDGVFVSKIFRGQLTEEVLCGSLAKFFKKVQIVKPAASRSSSMEAFVVCSGYGEEGVVVNGVKCIG